MWRMEVCRITKTTMLIMKILVVIGWISSIGFNGVLVAADPFAPAMFVFGDSLADAGNNNFIPGCTIRANFTPYGISSFRHPTGRFTNGRTVFDFVATYLRLPFPPPFLKPGAKFSCGINFASAGSGLFDSTGNGTNIIPLNQQIQQFQNLSYIAIKEEGAEKAKDGISKALFCISIGANDIKEFFTNHTPPVTNDTQLITLMVDKYDQYLTGLYSVGARKILVADVSVLGCTPYARNYGFVVYNGKCVDVVNQLVVEYNTALRQLLDRLNQNLDGISIILLKSYHYIMKMIRHGELYGFSETKKACCGSGRFHVEVACGKTHPPNQYCKDPDTHLFWDHIHPTQKTCAIFAQEIWTGNSSVMHPFNLYTLIFGRNASN